MTNNRYSQYARAILLMMTGMVLMTGCIIEGIEPGMKKIVSDGSVTLNIAMPDPVQKNMTRAVPSEYTDIKDLNIIIAEGNDADDKIQAIFYIDLANVEGSSIPGSSWVEVTEEAGEYSIHFEKEWFENFFISSEDCAFFLLANWGNMVSRDTDRISVGETVEDLRTVKVERRDYAMFGESRELAPGHTGPDGVFHADGRTLEVQLERMVAMITVAIDGEHLAPGVEILPVSISLHNVPNYGTFGADNILTGADRITPLTDEGGTSMIFRNGPSENVSDWGTISTGVTVGGHYTDIVEWNPEDSEKPNIDWSNAAVRPLFMYENYHGVDFGEPVAEGQQAYKRPAASIVGGYSDDTPTRDEIAAVAGACSYLQVTANYRDTGSGEYGTVTYRLFLGSNTYDNFDVIRNTYYRITLDLAGGAIGEADYSWRVNANLGTYEIIGESDIILNGPGEMFLIQIPESGANNANAQFAIEFDSDDPWANNNGNPFVWIATETGGTTWMALTDDGKTKFPEEGDLVFQFWFFVEPMIPGVTWNGPGHARRVRFRLVPETAGANQGTEWISVTQYEPISITIDSNSPESIREYVQDLWGWDSASSRTFYIDRMDRTDSWGFDNLTITNSGSGFDNGINLRGNAQAANYTPTGAGSVVMRAAFMPYYQRATPTGIPYRPNITQIRGDFNSPDGYPRRFFIPSVNEWRLIDMLFEAGVTVEDPAVSPIIWNNYWTSDAVPGSTGSSYVYRMGHPEETIEDKGSMPRTTPLSYRMMYFQP